MNYTEIVYSVTERLVPTNHLYTTDLRTVLHPRIFIYNRLSHRRDSFYAIFVHNLLISVRGTGHVSPETGMPESKESTLYPDDFLEGVL